MNPLHHLPAQRRDRGAVLIFALLILTVGALVLGGIAQKAATQNVSSQWETDLAERRIMVRNSRALARQFVLSHMFYGYMPMPPSLGTNSFTAGYTNPTLGGFSITNKDERVNFWQTGFDAGAAAMVNPFSPFERGGFYRVILSAELWDGSTNNNTVPWNYLVRSRSPIAAGYSLVLQKPAATPSSAVTFENNPYISLIGEPAWVGFPGMPIIPVASVTNTNVDSTGYQGYLDVPLAIRKQEDFPDSGPDSGVSWIESGGPGGPPVCVIDLSKATASVTTPPGGEPETIEAYGYIVPGFYPTDSTESEDAVVAVHIYGHDDPSPPPLQVRMTNCPSVSLLVLFGANQRSIYVNRRNAAATLTVAMELATDWRMGLTVQDTPVELFAPGQVTFVGGVRTDTEVEVNSATLIVEPDSDPGNLDVVGDRMMWLEDSMQ